MLRGRPSSTTPREKTSDSARSKSQTRNAVIGVSLEGLVLIKQGKPSTRHDRAGSSRTLDPRDLRVAAWPAVRIDEPNAGTNNDAPLAARSFRKQSALDPHPPRYYLERAQIIWSHDHGKSQPNDMAAAIQRFPEQWRDYTAIWGWPVAQGKKRPKRSTPSSRHSTPI